MKKLNKSSKLIAVTLLAAVSVICFPNRAEATEPKEESFASSFGMTLGQSVRFTLFNIGDPSRSGPVEVTLTFTSCAGGTVAQSSQVVDPGGCIVSDLNANQLPQTAFDNTGRAQLLIIVVCRLPGGGCVAPSLEVFDQQTGRTVVAIPMNRL